MKHLKWLGFLIIIFSFVILGTDMKAHASEISMDETEVTFDLDEPGMQEESYIDENGEEVTISIEPVEEILDNNVITPFASHLFPNGTTSYKVKANSIHMGMHFYVKVYVPSGSSSGSKITKAYSPDYWVLGGSLSDTSLTRSDKQAKYSANASWMGGYGGSSVWLKATLSGNKLTTSARF